MKKSKSKIRIKTRIYVPVVFILAVLLLTYAFPRQGKFKYNNFKEDAPWQYGLLTAPFNFSIPKPPLQYQQEVDSALVFFEPYYRVNKDAQTEAMANFDADSNLDPILSNLERSYIAYIRTKLNDIYSKGIISSDDYDKLISEKKDRVRLREDNEAKPRKVESFYTYKTAYEAIIDDAPQMLQKNKLKSADVNNYLQENIVYDASTSKKAETQFINEEVSPTIGFVQAGQRIIGEGEIVNKDVHRILTALKSATEEKTGEQSKSILILLGEFFLIATLLGAFYTYLLFFRKKEATNKEHITFMVLIITIFVILTAISVKYTLFNVYMIPFTIVTILIRTFIDSRTALNASLVTILLSSLMVPGETLVPHKASVISSTLRTDTPAKYISINASSTELSLRRYRSIIAVSKAIPFSFGIFNFTLPEVVVKFLS